MFKATLFIVVKELKESKCPPTDKLKTKMWHIDTMEYYLVIKRNEVLTQAIMLMNI